jgi:hypothetical protein
LKSDALKAFISQLKDVIASTANPDTTKLSQVQKEDDDDDESEEEGEIVAEYEHVNDDEKDDPTDNEFPSSIGTYIAQQASEYSNGSLEQEDDPLIPPPEKKKKTKKTRAKITPTKVKALKSKGVVKQQSLD